MPSKLVCGREDEGNEHRATLLFSMNESVSTPFPFFLPLTPSFTVFGSNWLVILYSLVRCVLAKISLHSVRCRRHSVCIYPPWQGLRTKLARCSVFPTAQLSDQISSVFFILHRMAFGWIFLFLQFTFGERLAMTMNLVLGHRRRQDPMIRLGVLLLFSNFCR